MPEQLTLEALSAPLLISELEGPYQADFEQFVSWCMSVGAPSLPSAPTVIARYGKQLFEDGSKPRTILRKLSSIAAAHRDASEPLVADNHDAIGRLRKFLRKEIARAERPTLAVVRSGMRSSPNTSTPSSHTSERIRRTLIRSPIWNRHGTRRLSSPHTPARSKLANSNRCASNWSSRMTMRR